ncbi:glycosyltransferase [Alkalihalobacillus sp. BA299]|uniref:glycosyltransferase n=1 Tax=Alkalihalobacillus sp. BA299 TaxID=2815938 RepID=UPI001ADA1B05|nr:glycosyltransferase [Alkalihalobacillus sp. BA299]
MEPKISVVIPVYNVEKWISDCIEILLNQPYNNLEILLINDGSTDYSGIICDKLAEKDKRITVFHKNNGGVSSARNKGIQLATGDYIVFIDADDKVDREFFVKLVSIAQSKKCDVVISGYKTIPNKQNIVPGYKLNELLDGKSMILSSNNIHSNNDLCFSWRYFYKLKVITDKKIKFSEKISIGEDVIFNLEVLLASSRVYAIPEPLYFYTINNSESAMSKQHKPLLNQSLIEQYKLRRELSEKAGLLKQANYRKDMAYYYIKNIYTLLINNIKHEESNFTKLREIVNYDMITDSIREIGFSYECNNYREYIYYLSLKFKVYPLLKRSLKNIS